MIIDLGPIQRLLLLQQMILLKRVHAYKTMRNELHNIEASQKLSQDKEWQDRLGTEEELQQAHNIIKNSLRATLNNICDVVFTCRPSKSSRARFNDY